MRRIRPLAALVLVLAGCGGDQDLVPLEITWGAIDSLNALLPPGVRVYAGRSTAPPIRAWYVRVAEPDSGITTRVVLSDDSADHRETVASFAADPGACVAVNGGFFSMDRTPAVHAGLLVVGGQLRAPATRTVRRDTLPYPTARAALGFKEDGTIEVAWAVSNGDSVFTLAAPPRNRPGQPAPAPRAADRKPWSVRDALAAGPMLVTDGRIRVTANEEVFFGTSVPRTHPRTAAGRTADGALILLVVDGRQAESRGVNLTELAEIMRDLGAVQALNLDGGGSAALIVRNRLLNRPVGDTVQREVMSALVTYCR